MDKLSTFVLLLWLPLCMTEPRNNFLGACISFTLDQNVDKTTNVHVQLMTRWVLGRGPCGTECSFELSDLYSSTLDTRHQIESLHNDTAYFGNFTLIYVADGTLLVDPLLDGMVTTLSETVVGLDDVEKWEEEEMFFSIALPETTHSTLYSIDFTGQSWVPLLFHGDDLPWHLQAVIQYTGARNDTEALNHSPKVVAEPVYKVKYNETSILALQVTDDDGDDAICDDKNNGSRGIIVHSNCSVTIDANELNGYTNDSWVAVFLSVSDVNEAAIEIGLDIVKPGTPLSTVDAQVIVHIVDVADKIRLTNPTPPTGTTFDLYVGTRWTILIYIHANTHENLTVIVESSGNTTISTTALIEPPTTYQPNFYVSNLAWTPDRNSVGSNSLCIKIADSDGAESENRCYSLIVKTPDPCDISPCVRGVCFSHLDDFFCMCPVGYQGTYCEKDIDECNPNPCMSGASCVNGANDYVCICPPGFQGRRCEIDIDECSVQPCKNDGVCTDGVDSFTCDCPMGYAGPVCDDTKGPKCFSCRNITSITECTTVTTCQNSETCSLERKLNTAGDGYVFHVGCKAETTCNTHTNHGDHCLNCCKGDYCNTNGCSLSDFPERYSRGPLCFDCDDIGHTSSCKTVVMCRQDEVCTFYGSRFTNFDSKCYHKDFPCGVQTSSGDESYLCHTCCQDDFCNTSCNHTTTAESIIIG